MKWLACTALALLPSIASAAECNCTEYPFKPNPPCYSKCVKTIVKDKTIPLSSIKDLDPAVAEQIESLRTLRWSKSLNKSLGTINSPNELRLETKEMLKQNGPR